MSEDRRRAVELTVEALRRVLDPAAVAAMRDDSPLAGLGLEDADLVCVAEAIAERSGGTVLLDDADVVDLVTVADLVGAVRAATARVNAS